MTISHIAATLNRTRKILSLPLRPCVLGYDWKTWGDSLIVPLLTKTAQYGLDNALDSILGFNSKTLSGLWKSAMETYYNKYIEDSATYVAGKKLISEKNAGKTNLSPSLSPDGKYFGFFRKRYIYLRLVSGRCRNGKDHQKTIEHHPQPRN